MVITSRAPVRIDFAGAWTDVPIFARGAGGAVVNAAIDRYVHGRLEVVEDPRPGEDGIRVTYQSDLPAGSGLGTSAALNVCWLGLIESQLDPGNEYRARIAELAFRLEELLGILGGKQDQYASALGGFNFLQFGEEVRIEPLPIPPKFISQLESRLILCYTGKSRLSSNIHEKVWSAFRRGEPETVTALYSLREGALAMKESLLREDLDGFARLIGKSWANQKALDPSVTNEAVDSLFAAALNSGATTGKACGAGGGGCLLFVTEPENRSRLTAALESLGAREITFRFEFDGLQISREG